MVACWSLAASSASRAPLLSATPTTKSAAKKAKKNRKDVEEDNTIGGMEKGKDQSRDNRPTLTAIEVLTEHKCLPLNIDHL